MIKGIIRSILNITLIVVHLDCYRMTRDPIWPRRLPQQGWRRRRAERGSLAYVLPLPWLERHWPLDLALEADQLVLLLPEVQ